MKHIVVKGLTSLVLVVLSLSLGQSFTVASWNVESGGSNDAFIEQQLTDIDGVDIWGLSEVQDFVTSTSFKQGSEADENANFESILGTTGSGDKLQIIYNHDRFEVLSHSELHDINVDDTVRAPLVAHLRERDSGEEFLFMVNHLARGDRNNGTPNRRRVQAQLLNDWASQQSLPIIAVGDYNFDWEVIGGDQDHGAGYDLLIADEVFSWVRPDTLVRTQCSATASGCRFNSVLDFVFLAGEAQTWTASSTILVIDGDFPDDDNSSDHRPVLATFSISDETPDNAAIIQALLERIETLERELEAIRDLVNQLQ